VGTGADGNALAVAHCEPVAVADCEPVAVAGHQSVAGVEPVAVAGRISDCLARHVTERFGSRIAGR
jgi:hypothetical protein